MTSLMEEIRRAILTGDIDHAISLTKTFYPTVLEKNEPIHFRLRARKFVEMIRMCAEGTGSGSTATKSIDSPYTEKMAIDQEEDEQVDDEVHMTDVTPTHHDTKFVIDDDEEDSDDDNEPMTTTKQQRKQEILLGEALEYGQRLHEDYRDDPREEVKCVMKEAFSLLAYTDPRGSVVGHLLEESGRREVAEELNSAILGKPLKLVFTDF
jgi:Ran-binding protein 9/10